MRTQEHYGTVKGQQAGAVTYFAFLSFFPILALAFFVVGQVAQVYPDAQEDLVTAIDTVPAGPRRPRRGPGVVTDIQDAARSLFGLLGAVRRPRLDVRAARRAGGRLRAAEPGAARFVFGKLRDLLSSSCSASS